MEEEDSWTQLMSELHALNAASIQKHRGKLENAIHQSLDPCNDKSKQTRQLNVIAEISRLSMEAVQRELEKNMAKFDLYVRRNPLSVPEHLRDEVAAIRAREKQKKLDESDPEAAKQRAIAAAQEKLQQAQKQIEERRREILQMDTRMEQLKQETRALAQTNAKFRDFLQAQDHILRIPSDITNPLKRTTQELTRLHAHAEQMDMMQGALDEDARAFKRAKADTRATFLNLRKRFAMKMKASPALSEFATALGANGSR